jgi:hypothetical protein
MIWKILVIIIFKIDCCAIYYHANFELQIQLPYREKNKPNFNRGYIAPT